MSEYKEIVKDGVKNIGDRIRKFFLYVAGFILLGFVSYIAICNFTYSNGTRSGYLVKITKKGYLFKTYEGTLGITGMAQTKQGFISTNWDFSVKSKDVYKKLDSLQGIPVKLYYKEKLKSMPWQGDTPYFVYDVERVIQ